jgi:hypothetical protein
MYAPDAAMDAALSAICQTAFCISASGSAASSRAWRSVSGLETIVSKLLITVADNKKAAPESIASLL